MGLKILKNRLSEYVRLAAAGETVLITDRDRVVAEIVPPSASRGSFPADALLREAVRKGHVTLPALPASGVPARRPVMPFSTLMQAIEDERKER